MTAVEIGNKLQEYKELKNYSKEIEAELKALEDDIKAEMEMRNTEEITTDLFKVTYKPVVSCRFDSKAFKADSPEVYAQYQKKTVSKRFVVS